MNCKNFTDVLLELVSDELDADQAAEAESHLAECANCRAFSATYRVVPGLVEWAFSEQAGIDDVARDALSASLTEADQKAIEDALFAELRKRA